MKTLETKKQSCTNKTKGCKWVGELGALKHHLESDNGCDYVMVTCSNTAYNVMQIRRSTLTKCGAAMERRLLADHQKSQCLYRQYTCEYCGYINTYDAIAGSGEINQCLRILFGMIPRNHYSECNEYPLDCPNKCGTENIKRKDMEERKEICPLEAIVCPFTNHSFKILRRDLQTHTKECDFRPCRCQYCEFSGTYTSITGKGKTPPKHCHYDTCDEYPLDCPNKCSAHEIKRKNLKKHREKCPLELLDCPFKYAGCTSTEQRKDMDCHCRKSMQEHLLLVAQSHQKLTCENKELVSKVEELTCKVKELSHKNEEMAGRVEQLSRKTAHKIDTVTHKKKESTRKPNALLDAVRLDLDQEDYDW